MDSTSQRQQQATASENTLTPTLKYECQRCAADPQPSDFGSRRNCAFTDDGTFTPDNWNCATIRALFAAAGEDDGFGKFVEGWGDDESLQAFSARMRWLDEDGYPESGTQGFIVLTRYKSRGCTSSAVHVGDFWPPKPVTLGDFWPPKPVTLELVNSVIAAYQTPGDAPLPTALDPAASQGGAFSPNRVVPSGGDSGRLPSAGESGCASAIPTDSERKAKDSASAILPETPHEKA
jgi:hypothetical protein